MRGHFIFACLLCVLASGEAFEVAKHHNYEEVVATLQEVNQKCPDITYHYKLRAPEGQVGTTWQGRNLDVLVMSDNPKEHEPRK